MAVYVRKEGRVKSSRTARPLDCVGRTNTKCVRLESLLASIEWMSQEVFSLACYDEKKQRRLNRQLALRGSVNTACSFLSLLSPCLTRKHSSRGKGVDGLPFSKTSLWTSFLLLSVRVVTHEGSWLTSASLSIDLGSSGNRHLT